jgi:hypothetical protein
LDGTLRQNVHIEGGDGSMNAYNIITKDSDSDNLVVRIELAGDFSNESRSSEEEIRLSGIESKIVFNISTIYKTNDIFLKSTYLKLNL